MNRTVIAAAAAVVLLGVALVGGAAVTGTQAKKRLQAAPQAWQAQWPMLKVVDQHYQRGLFSSTHDVTLQFGCDSGAAAGGKGPLTLTLRQRVQHGPLPGFRGVGAAVVDTELVLPDALQKALAGLTGNQPPLRMHSVVGLGGTTDTQLVVPAMKSAAADEQQFSFEGLNGELHDDGTTLRYDVAMPALSVKSHDARMAMQMTLRGARVHGEIGGRGSLLWTRPGQAHGELAQLEMQMSAGPGAPAMPPMKFALRQVQITSANTLDKELLNAVARLSAQGEFNDVKLDRIEMQASFKRLHAPSYEHLVQRVMDTGATACDMKQAVSPQVMLAQLQQDLVALLPYNPEYTLDKLAVETGGRRAELSYAVGVEGVTAEDTALPLQALFIGKGHVRAEAQLPMAWVEQAVARFGGAGQADPAAQAEMVNVMLAKLTNDGFIVREGEMLRTRLSFEKGQMLVNGKPLARPPMQ
jgi:uncharacterized protein YdgA (DUF945 family)